VLKRFIKSFVVATASICLTSPAWAGAWNQRSGEGQLITTSSWAHAGEIFNDDFEAVPLRGFTKVETRLYLEQGVTDWLTLVGNTGFQSLNFRDGDSRFDFEGLDDIELGAQLRVHADEGGAASVRLSYVIDSKLDNQVVDILRGGDEIELRALIGQSRETSIGDIFYDAQFALRSEEVTDIDALQGALTLGYKPTDRWLLMSQSFANYSVGGETDFIAADNEVDTFTIGQQLQVKSQISLARQYKPGRYFQLGAGTTVFGQNIVKERSVFISLWTEY